MSTEVTFYNYKVEVFGGFPAIAHRGSTDYLTHCVNDLTGYIDEIEVIIVYAQHTNEWWITPNNPSDEKYMDDYGPYHSPEEVLIHFKLIAEPSE
jgi:hypothetical protein